jgi:hypothetical protein
MCPIKARSSPMRLYMWCLGDGKRRLGHGKRPLGHGERRLGHCARHGIAHRMMVVEPRWLSCRWGSDISLSLHRVGSSAAVDSSHRSTAYTWPWLVRRMVE